MFEFTFERNKNNSRNVKLGLIYAFDLLKNEGQDRTTLVVQCLICKTVSGTEQTGGKGQDKNSYFCSSPNHSTTFCPTYKLSKIAK